MAAAGAVSGKVSNGHRAQLSFFLDGGCFCCGEAGREGCEGLSVSGTACGGCRRRGLGGVSPFLEHAGSVRELDTWPLLQGQLGLGTVVVCPDPGLGAFICITLPQGQVIAQFLSFSGSLL